MKYNTISMSLGPLESRFFAYTQSRELQTVYTGDLVGPLGLTPTQERKLLSRMSGRGLIARVRRGMYLVPSRLPVGGKWAPGQALALTALIQDRNGQYQICGPSAFHRYGWDDQVPVRTYAYNNRISGERQIGMTALTMIKVADRRLGGTDAATTPEGIDLIYSSRVRALMDAVYDWSRFNTLPRAFGWIRSELAKNEALPAQLIDAALRFSNQSTLRRIGVILETEITQQPLLRKIEKALRPSSSFIPLVPTLPKRGKTVRRWGVVINDG